HHVRAKKRERAGLSEVVPVLLEANGRLGIAASPEHVDHFSVCADPPSSRGAGRGARGGAIDDAAEVAAEELPARMRADHEARQRLIGIEHEDLPFDASALDVGPAAHETLA